MMTRKSGPESLEPFQTQISQLRKEEHVQRNSNSLEIVWDVYIGLLQRQLPNSKEGGETTLTNNADPGTYIPQTPPCGKGRQEHSGPVFLFGMKDHGKRAMINLRKRM